MGAWIRITLLLSAVAVTALAVPIGTPLVAEVFDEPAASEEMLAWLNSQKDKSWVAGINERFEGYTLRDIQETHLGVLAANPPTSLPVFTHPVGLREAMPDEFDSSKAFPACESRINAVHDQGSCGSCWAIAPASVISDRYIAVIGKLKT